MNKILIIMFILCSSFAYAGPSEEDSPNIPKLRSDMESVADAVERVGQVTQAEKIRTAIETMTDEELYLGYGQVNLIGLAEAFNNTATALDTSDEMLLERGYIEPKTSFNSSKKESFQKELRSIAGLPDAVGYPGLICPFSPERSNADDLLVAVDAIEAANIALEVAEGVWSLTDRACGLVVVAIGAVGNPQTAACIAADVILFAAKAVVNTAQAVVNHIDFCDAAVDAAEIEGSYERLGHMHTDLEAHDTNIDGDLAAHDTNIDGDLAAHDTNIDGDLAAHDTNIDTDLAAHDANIDADLVAHNLNIDTDLSNHDTEIKALLGNVQTTLELMKRLHIDVIQEKKKEHYILSITESGIAVSGAQITALYAGAPKKNVPFQNIINNITTTELRPGILEVMISSEIKLNDDTILQFELREDGHGPFPHFGTAVVSISASSKFLGPGQ